MIIVCVSDDHNSSVSIRKWRNNLRTMKKDLRK